MEAVFVLSAEQSQKKKNWLPHRITDCRFLVVTLHYFEHNIESWVQTLDHTHT